jgi:hypothetical protein
MQTRIVSLVFLIVLFSAIMGMHVYANMHFLYYEIPWLDIPMHFLGGFWLGYSALWVYTYSGFFRREDHRDALPSVRYMWFLALLCALVLGGIWEIYEYAMDMFFDRTYQYDVFDTLSDFFFDALGGTVAAFIFMSRRFIHKDND